MMIRTAILLLLLLPAAGFPQDLDTAASAVVQISGTRNGATVRGSGFVVGLDRDKKTVSAGRSGSNVAITVGDDKAMIVTVSHVIAGLENIQVTFAADLTESFPAEGFLRMDAESPKGPAVLQVHGALPAGVTVLSFESEKRPRLGEALYLLGFPQMATSLRKAQRTLSAQEGTSLLIDQGLGEGSSGGPVLQNGKVVGVVTGVDDQTTYAVEAVVVRAALEGWGVKLGGQAAAPRTPTTGEVLSGPAPIPPSPALSACVPGQSVTEDGVVYVRICPGTFTMGSAADDSQAYEDEKPAHQVTLSDEFWLGQTEVTNAQYHRIQPDHEEEDEFPAVEVTWTEAQAACERFGGRLPTEAEWEYAARAGSTTAWSFSAGDYAWNEQNAGNTPHSVAAKKPNRWGLYDMQGNVWEWVADWYAPYSATAQRDPDGPATGGSRVLRGGAFSLPPEFLRSAFRSKFQPWHRSRAIGFRCARGPRRQP